MKGLILAGGNGTRLRPLTHTGPKQLIPIANKPNILYCLEDLRDAGITDIGIILGNNMPEKVRELLNDGSQFGVSITYIEQGDPKGIAHAVGCAEEFMAGEPFVVYLGDNILQGGIRYMVDEFAAGDMEALVALTPVDDPTKFGIAELDGEGNIIGLVEKPKQPKSDLAMIGIYFLRSSVFPIIHQLKPSWRNELEITDAIDTLRRTTGKVAARNVRGWWKDTGRPEDIIHANRMVLSEMKGRIDGVVEEGARVDGEVTVGEGTVIKSGSAVHGPVIIGRDCVIGPAVRIGPYVAIGDQCSVSNGELEESIIMSGTIISCSKRIVDSLIGSGCVIESQHKKSGLRLVLGENSQLRA